MASDVEGTKEGILEEEAPNSAEEPQSGEHVHEIREEDAEAEIRSKGLQLRGEGLPNVADIRLSYREAWKVGKQGCLGVRRNMWDPHIFSVTWYFVCDGTDPSNFLVLHPHSESHGSGKLIISMWDLLDGFWVANKCRILYHPRSGDGVAAPSNKTMAIEGFTREFYEAMIVCIHESQVRIQLMNMELRSLQEGFNNVGATRCKAVAPRFRRSLIRYSEGELAARVRSANATAGAAQTRNAPTLQG